MTTQNPNTENQNTTTDLYQQFTDARARFCAAWERADFPIDVAILGKDTYIALLKGARDYFTTSTTPCNLGPTVAYAFLRDEAETAEGFEEFIAYIISAAEAIESAIEGADECPVLLMTCDRCDYRKVRDTDPGAKQMCEWCANYNGEADE